MQEKKARERLLDNPLKVAEFKKELEEKRKKKAEKKEVKKAKKVICPMPSFPQSSASIDLAPSSSLAISRYTYGMFRRGLIGRRAFINIDEA